MADITYTVNQSPANTIQGVESFSQADSQLVNQFEINTLFDRDTNYVELHILNLADELLQSNYNYTDYRELGNAQSAGKSGASVLTIDCIQDIDKYGYLSGDVKLLYHFIDDLFSRGQNTTQFFIKDISADRTELKLQTFELSSEELASYVTQIKDKFSTQSYFNEFRLNFRDNNLYIGVNIDVLLEEGSNVVVVKLYEPLPEQYDVKSVLSVVELVSDSIAFEIGSITEIQAPQVTYIRPANLSIDLEDTEVVPTQYLSQDELFSYPINNSTNQLYSLVSEKGAELSIDHTDYKNFVHFSSAYERLANFKYKLQLIETYSSSLAQVSNATSQSVGVTGSISYYEGLTQGVLSNLDHYERFLYYESSSYSWPKSSNIVPYSNVATSNPIAQNWYAAQLSIANRYDSTNLNAVVNTIPSFLRDDSNNQNYLTFIYMIGQHFDNLWIYAKGVSDKYDADNRLEAGISKDLIGEVLKNFGVKLYTSNNSIQDLFGSFIGQAYQSGSEDINYYITGSLTGSNTPIQPTSFDNYNKEIQKRIYHNLPLLLKSKGTERGLRALINCFGIPSNVLDIKLYGGTNVNQRPFYGDYQHYTSSLDKIRLDNTGSITPGDTLSQYTSINKREYKYTDDVHSIEVGFSPTDNVDNFIISKSLSTGSLSSFNIDQYLGDPRNMTSDRYELLDSTGIMQSTLLQLADSIMSGSSAYDVQDYVRLIKFFDNTIFKMVKDFIPARSIADTGIIIKPHILHRNKAKSPTVQGTRPEHSASIDTAFIRGTDGGMYNTSGRVYRTAYVQSIQTPLGEGEVSYINEQAKYNGELNSSNIRITTGELNSANAYKTQVLSTNPFDVYRWANADNLCIIQPTGVQYIQQSGSYPANYFFSGVGSTYEYTHSLVGGATTQPFTFPLNTDSYQNYSQHIISASNTAISACSASTQVQIAICGITPNANFQTTVSNLLPYNITQWFTIASTNAPNNIQYKLNGDIILDSTDVHFTGLGTTATLTVLDTAIPITCIQNYTINVAECTLGVRPTGIGRLDNVYTRGAWILDQDIGYTGQQQFLSPLTAETLGLASIFTGVTPGITAYQVQLTLGDGNNIFNPLITITPNTQEQTLELVEIGGERIGIIVRYSYLLQPGTGQVARLRLETSSTGQLSADYYASQIRLRITAYNPALLNCAANTVIFPATLPPPDLIICEDGRVVNDWTECLADDDSLDNTGIPIG